MVHKLLLAFVCLTSSLPVIAADDKAPNPTHRVDFGLSWFDTPGETTINGGLYYAWAPSNHHSFTGALALVDAEQSNATNSGVGDLQLQYNYVPHFKLSAAPWVPDSLGIGFGLVAPTGDLDEGTGGGRWVASPSIGWVVPLDKGFAFLPRGIYAKSFDEEEGARELEQVTVQLSVLYVQPNNWWIQYEPTVIHDSSLDDFEFGHILTIGKELTRRIAISLDLRALPNIDLPVESGIASGAGYRATLKLKWVIAF